MRPFIDHLFGPVLDLAAGLLCGLSGGVRGVLGVLLNAAIVTLVLRPPAQCECKPKQGGDYEFQLHSITSMGGRIPAGGWKLPFERRSVCSSRRRSSVFRPDTRMLRRRCNSMLEITRLIEKAGRSTCSLTLDVLPECSSSRCNPQGHPLKPEMRGRRSRRSRSHQEERKI